MARKAVEARVTGRVQGVGFRAWTAREARALGIAGWVRNEPDGTVAALMAGERTALETMLERLRQGPPGAIVGNVTAKPADAAGVANAFRILR